jgi:hypothetical protein
VASTSGPARPRRGPVPADARSPPAGRCCDDG